MGLGEFGFSLDSHFGPLLGFQLRCGSVAFRDGRVFAPHCTSGDWIRDIAVSFSDPMEVANLAVPAFEVVVLISASRRGLAAAPPDQLPGPVPVVRSADNRGFTFDARNAAAISGQSSFDWIAIGAPGKTMTHQDITFRWGNTDWQRLGPQGAAEFFKDHAMVSCPRTVVYRDGRSAVVATPNNLFIEPLSPHVLSQAEGAYAPTTSRNSPAVPLVIPEGWFGAQTGAVVFARNTEPWAGAAGFYYFGMRQTQKGDGVVAPNFAPWIQVGLTPLTQYRDTSITDTTAWRRESIAFALPFVAPPTILLSAAIPVHHPMDRESKFQACSPIGIAQDVSGTRFTLASRNSACEPGESQFFWVAIGCPMCGTKATFEQASGQILKGPS